MDREGGADLDIDPLGQDRHPRARRLRRPHDRPAPEQLLLGAEQRVVEATLTRQDIDETQVDRSTPTARAIPSRAPSPRTLRKRRLDCGSSFSNSSGRPPGVLQWRRRSSGMRLKKSGWSSTVIPHFVKIPASSASVIAASTSAPPSVRQTPV